MLGIVGHMSSVRPLIHHVSAKTSRETHEPGYLSRGIADILGQVFWAAVLCPTVGLAVYLATSCQS